MGVVPAEPVVGSAAVGGMVGPEGPGQPGEGNSAVTMCRQFGLRRLNLTQP